MARGTHQSVPCPQPALKRGASTWVLQRGLFPTGPFPSLSSRQTAHPGQCLLLLRAQISHSAAHSGRWRSGHRTAGRLSAGPLPGSLRLLLRDRLVPGARPKWQAPPRPAPPHPGPGQPSLLSSGNLTQVCKTYPIQGKEVDASKWVPQACNLTWRQSRDWPLVPEGVRAGGIANDVKVSATTRRKIQVSVRSPAFSWVVPKPCSMVNLGCTPPVLPS